MAQAVQIHYLFGHAAQQTTMTQHPDTDTTRATFEQWYAENAFDYARNPIGSRECGLQWAAWRAATAAERERKRRIAVAARAVTTNCMTRADTYDVPAHLIVGLILALDDSGE